MIITLARILALLAAATALTLAFHSTEPCDTDTDCNCTTECLDTSTETRT